MKKKTDVDPDEYPPPPDIRQGIPLEERIPSPKKGPLIITGVVYEVSIKLTATTLAWLTLEGEQPSKF